MRQSKQVLVGVLLIVLLIGVPWWIVSYDSSFSLNVTIKISTVKTYYNPMGGSSMTDIISWDGNYQLTFWGNIARIFKVGKIYNITYHPKTIFISRAYELIACVEIKT